jgi:hypothetical protein
MKLDSNKALCGLLSAISDEDFEATMKSIDQLKEAITETGLPKLDCVYDDRKADVCWGKFLNEH